MLLNVDDNAFELEAGPEAMLESFFVFLIKFASINIVLDILTNFGKKFKLDAIFVREKELNS